MTDLIDALSLKGVWILTLSTDTYWELGTVHCMNKAYFNMVTAVPILEAMAFIIITFVCDAAMIRFIRNRSRVAPVQMSVWSTNESSREEGNTFRSHNDVLKATIPVQSTILLTTFTVICSALSAYLLSSTHDVSWPIGRSVTISLLGLQMPLILILTVKNQEKNKRPVPPQGLQFHGLDSEEDNSKWATVANRGSQS